MCGNSGAWFKTPKIKPKRRAGGSLVVKGFCTPSLPLAGGIEGFRVV